MFIRSFKDMDVLSRPLVVPVALFVECWVLCPGPHSVPGRVLRTESPGSWVRASINPLGQDIRPRRGENLTRVTQQMVVTAATC